MLYSIRTGSHASSRQMSHEMTPNMGRQLCMRLTVSQIRSKFGTLPSAKTKPLGCTVNRSPIMLQAKSLSEPSGRMPQLMPPEWKLSTRLFRPPMRTTAETTCGMPPIIMVMTRIVLTEVGFIFAISGCWRTTACTVM